MKRLIATILSIFIIIANVVPAFSVYDPNPKHSKWHLDKIVNDPTVKSSVEIKAQKTYPITVYDPNVGKNVTKTKKLSSITKVAPTAKKMATRFARGANAVLLSVTVAEIIGDGVDWILDEGTQTIKYKQNAEGRITYCAWFDECQKGIYAYKSDVAAANKSCNNYDQTFVRIVEKKPYYNGQYLTVVCMRKNGSEDLWNIKVKINDKDEEQELSLEEVAEKVKQKAEAGGKEAQDFIKDTALEMFNNGELDNELDNNAKDTDTNIDDDTEKNNDTDTQPSNPSTQPKLPKFCEWTGMCPTWRKTEKNTRETAENTKEIKEHTKSIDDFLHDDKIPRERTEVPFQNEQLQDPSSFDRPYIQAPSQCPDDITAQIPMGLNTVNLVFPMTPICNFGSTFIKPVIIFMSYILGALFIANGFKVG